MASSRSRERTTVRDSITTDIMVGPFRLPDLTREGVCARAIDLGTNSRDSAAFTFALHVGGLNARHQRDFVEAMHAADLVHADGGSTVWLARLAGALNVERAPTTDIGWEILAGLASRLGRPVRIALVGGRPGLAERAGQVLVDGGPVVVVAREHGYHQEWEAVLTRLRDSNPDVVIVGLGAPREMVWCHAHRALLPPALVLTCGGWFGHLVGDERRAPRLLRRSGLEWIARVAQAPRRLGPRYVLGIVSCVVLALQTILRKVRPNR